MRLQTKKAFSAVILLFIIPFFQGITPVNAAGEDLGYVDIIVQVPNATYELAHITLNIFVYTSNNLLKIAYPSRIIYLEQNQLLNAYNVQADMNTRKVSLYLPLNFTQATNATYRVYYSENLIQNSPLPSNVLMQRLLINATLVTTTVRTVFFTVKNTPWQVNPVYIIKHLNGTVQNFWYPNRARENMTFFMRTASTATTQSYVLEVYTPGATDQRTTTIFRFFDDFANLNAWSGSTASYSTTGGLLRKIGTASARIYATITPTSTSGLWYFLDVIRNGTGTQNLMAFISSGGAGFYIPNGNVLAYVTPTTSSIVMPYSDWGRPCLYGVNNISTSMAAYFFDGDMGFFRAGLTTEYVFRIETATANNVYIDTVFAVETYALPHTHFSYSVTPITNNIIIGDFVSFIQPIITNVPILIPKNVTIPLNFTWGTFNENGFAIIKMIAQSELGYYFLLILPLLLVLAVVARHTGAVVAATVSGLCAYINYSLNQSVFSTIILGWLAAICLLLFIIEQRRGSA